MTGPRKHRMTVLLAKRRWLIGGIAAFMVIAAVFFGRAPGDPISWTGRAAMFLGGVYFLKAVRSSFKASV